MGLFHFRRSIKLFPSGGVNLSKSGVSTSIGRRGAWFTIGSRGTRTTVGIPGTELRYTEQSAYHLGHMTQPKSEPATFRFGLVNAEINGNAPRLPVSTAGARRPHGSIGLVFQILATVALAAVAVFAALH